MADGFSHGTHGFLEKAALGIRSHWLIQSICMAMSRRLCRSHSSLFLANASFSPAPFGQVKSEMKRKARHEPILFGDGHVHV